MRFGSFFPTRRLMRRNVLSSVVVLAISISVYHESMRLNLNPQTCHKSVEPTRHAAETIAFPRKRFAT
jgi:hypothetical protein